LKSPYKRVYSFLTPFRCRFKVKPIAEGQVDKVLTLKQPLGEKIPKTWPLKGATNSLKLRAQPLGKAGKKSAFLSKEQKTVVH
jgi:hypothetical protein